MKEYKFKDIEKRWQKFWEEKQVFKSTEDSSRPKFYCLEMYPYPSGKLHMGHVRVYAIGDALARFLRLRGFNVLHPMGYDSFGLPAENAAIQRQTHPHPWTEQCIENMKQQQMRLGLSYDWERELATSHADYYHWNQWLFLKFYERGLAYRRKAPVNWCEFCSTVLANEQVINGACWRCENTVSVKTLEQWFLRITEYAERLLNDLEQLGGWPEHVRIMQRNWIGRSEGALVNFHLKDDPEVKLPIFTTRPDTLYGVTFMVFAPEHPMVLELVAGTSLEKKVKEYVARAMVEDRFLRTAEDREKEGIFLGRYAVNPLTGEELPLYTANFVLMEYGTGCIMAVPAHDQRDFEFARKYKIPIKVVIQPPEEELDPATMTEAYVEPGVMTNSAQFSEMDSEKAKGAITEYLKEQGWGGPDVQYKLRDWLISRQRYWGTPIPMLYCDKCGVVPVSEEELPVMLPEDVKFTGTGNPLATSESFRYAICPKCQSKARRETDTMDTFFDSSWYFLRYCDPHNERGAFDPKKARFWMPVEQYIGGVEHAVLHLLYARFFTKVIHDLGLIECEEPFTRLLAQGMVTKGGEAMSKSRGNIVEPETIIEPYGADTARMFILFASPAEKELEWSQKGVEGCFRFLNRLWRLVQGNKSDLMKGKQLAEGEAFQPSDAEERGLHRQLHLTIKRVTIDTENRSQFNTAIAATMELLNFLYQFKVAGEENKLRGFYTAVRTMLILLNPFAPHTTEELWADLGHKQAICYHSWPEWDEAALVTEEVTIPIQVNGKLRGRITVPTGLDDEEIKARALSEENIQRHIDNRQIRKVIYVPKKLINVVI